MSLSVLQAGPAAGSNLDAALSAKVPRALSTRAAASPVKLIIDTDMSTDVDDVAALCIAHTLQDLGRVEILAVLHDTGLPMGVGAISVINHHYGRDHIPIGAYKGAFGNPYDTTADAWTRRKAAGPYVEDLVANFSPPVRDSAQVPGAVDIYRSALAKQPDGSVVIVSIGFLGNLAALLDSEPDSYSALDGASLVKRKVAKLVAMGGMYPDSSPLGYEWNFGGGCQWGSRSCPYTPGWTRAVVDAWPTQVPLVFSGFEVGVGVKTGGTISACAPAESPCRAAFEAYRAFDPHCPPRSSWDPVTLLYAAEERGRWWDTRSAGRNRVDGRTGANVWVEGPGTNQSYLLLRKGVEADLAAAMDDLLCMPPAVTLTS